MGDLAVRALRTLLVAGALFSVGYIVVWGCATPTAGASVAPLPSTTSTAVGVSGSGGVYGFSNPNAGGSLWVRHRMGPHLELGGALSHQVFISNLTQWSAARLYITGMSRWPGAPFRGGTQLALEGFVNRGAGGELLYGPSAELSFPLQWEGESGSTFFVVPALGGVFLTGPDGTPAFPGGGDLRLTLGASAPVGNGFGLNFFIQGYGLMTSVAAGLGLTWGADETRSFPEEDRNPWRERRRRTRGTWR